MRRPALLVLALLGCGPGAPPFLSVDLTTDLVPGVEFTRVRTELSDAPFGAGAATVQQVEHAASADEHYGEGVRVAEITVGARGVRYLRVSLLDASGRIRGPRLATVEVNGATAVSIVIGSACNGVVCPGPGDPDDATACLNGVCVPSTCTPETPDTCPPTICQSDGDCAAGYDCHRPACVSGSCLLLDACLDGEVCTPDGCAPAPSCGDGACDPGSETPCACPDDCGSCPAGCGDGVCEAGEVAEGCPEDCGPPPATCGDGICESGETCREDCDVPGDPQPGEPGCTTCFECDAACGPACPDGSCNEPPLTCALDCGPPPTVCGDQRCDPGEVCPAECRGAICGDGQCTEGLESCGNCQNDCGWCGVGLPTIPFVRACVGRSGYLRGRRCAGIAGAWTDTADNVGYYPMATLRSTPLVSGERSGQLIMMLPPVTPVAIQSTRNPLCHDSPPLRPAVDGWVFGYVRGMSTATSGIGWMRIEDLVLDTRGGECANGPAGGAFQVRRNPYGRNGLCEQLLCDDMRSCRDANPIGEGAIECEGDEVDYDRIVDEDLLLVRFSPAGSPRRFLHRGDRVRVRYESPDRNYVFVRVETSQAPRLTPVGSSGWVRGGALRAP